MITSLVLTALGCALNSTAIQLLLQWEASVFSHSMYGPTVLACWASAVDVLATVMFGS